METGVLAYLTASSEGSALVPGDTVQFNDLTDAYGYGGVFKIERTPGLDGSPIRNPTENRPQKDGGINHPFYRGGRYFTIEGRIIANTTTHRREMEDRLRKVTQKMLRSDGQFVWSPTGADDRMVVTRLNDPVDIEDENSAIKTFSMQFFSESAYARDLAGTIITLTPSDTFTFTNEGNAPYWPLVEVYGPLGTFTLNNHTPDPDTPFAVETEVHWDGLGHLINDGDFAALQMEFERFRLDSDGSSELRYIDFTITDFFALWPGDNDLEFNASGIGGATKVKIYAYNGWV